MAGQINLFDPALLRKRDWLALSNVLILAALLMLAVAAAATLVRRDLPALTMQTAANEAQLKVMRDQVVVLGQRVANRKSDPHLESELLETRQLLAARNEILRTLQQGMDPGAGSFADYLRGFARQSLSGLWLTGIAVDAGSQGMEIRGRTIDPALLPEYIARLNKEPALQGRAFAALKLAEGKADAPADAAQKTLFHEFTLIPLKPSGQSGAPAASAQAMGGAR